MIYYNSHKINKLYNGTDLVTKMNKTVGDNVDIYETLQELIDTHTVVSIGSGKYNLEPSVSGLTFFRINLQYGAASKYIDLYREDETFDKYFGIRCDATGGLYKSIDGYSSIKSAADSTSCQWAYYVDTNIIEVDIVAAIGLTAHIGQINDGFNTSFISFLQHSSVAEDKAIFQYVSNNAAPYDAEIEYLENDGTQFINTNIALNPSNFEVGYEIESSGFWWGFTHQGRGNGTWISLEENSGGTSNTVFFGKFDNRFTASTASENTIKFVSTSGVTVNGTNYSKTFSLGTDSISSTPLYLFTRYDFASRSVDTTQWGFKLKSFYLKNNGELVLDMIPVRVGQVGYMYDKVSGQLFGNDGTGAFILGADK